MTVELEQAVRLLGRRWFDRNDAAAYLGIGPATFDKEVRPHLTPAILGRREKFDREEIDRLMESRKLFQSPM